MSLLERLVTLKKALYSIIVLDGLVFLQRKESIQIGKTLSLQGHPERMSKVNPFARALIFTKSGFSGVFWG